MLSRAVFEEVGRFNDKYYMYGDDVDLCFKVRRAGYGVHYIGSKEIIHHGGTSSAFRRETHFATVMQKEALFKFFQETRGAEYAALYRVAMRWSSRCHCRCHSRRPGRIGSSHSSNR